MKLNIGCGRDYREGWINIDISKQVKTEFIIDIRTATLPAKTETVDEIYISGVLEQIGDNDQLIHVINECWRALKTNGKMVVVVPNAKYAIAHRDPMDIRKFTPETFPYFIKETREYKHYGSVYGFKPWQNFSIEENVRHIMTITMTK